MLWENNNKARYYLKNFILFLSCIIFATIIFISIYGYKILDVTYDDWILYREDDLMQHYLGWKAYRKSNWYFPIGMIDNVIEPFKLSIYYTDSIPLISMIFKLFAIYLPSKFQFFGVYGLVCFALSAVFTARILLKYTDNIIFIILSSVFVLLLPVLYERMFTHTALASHWIIIYGLYYIFSYKFNKKISIWFLLIFPILSSSIHLYFLPMNFIIIFTYAILCSCNKKNVVYFFLIILSYILISFIIIYIYGGFDKIGNYADASIGNTNLNLNSLFQTFGRSRFIGSLPTHTQYPGETFIYVGLGGIFLILFVILNIAYKKNLNLIFNNNKILVFSLVFIIIVSILVSILPDIYFNDKLIFKVKLVGIIKYAFDIFRSNARFVWPGYYAGVIALLIIVAKNFNIKYALISMIIILFLQVVDYFDILKTLHNYYAYDITYETSFDTDALDLISNNKKIKNVVFISITQIKPRLLINNFCIDNNIATNDFYMARPIDITNEFYENTIKIINENPADTVFVIDKDSYFGNPFQNKEEIITEHAILFLPKS